MNCINKMCSYHAEDSMRLGESSLASTPGLVVNAIN